MVSSCWLDCMTIKNYFQKIASIHMCSTPNIHGTPCQCLHPYCYIILILYRNIVSIKYNLTYVDKYDV